MQHKKYWTRHPANALIAIGLIIGFSYVSKFLIFINVLNVLCLFVPLFLLTPFANTVLKQENFKTLKFLKLFKKTILYQILFFVATLLFLHAFVNHSNLSPRLQSINLSMLDDIFKIYTWNLLALPWILYTVIGVIIAYFTYIVGIASFIPEIVLPNAKNHPRLFFHNALKGANIAANGTILVVIMSVVIALFGEAFCTLYDLPSLGARPLQTSTIAIAVLWMQSQVMRPILGWLVRHDYSLGKILLCYTIAFTFFMIWFHDFLFGVFSFDEAKYLDASYMFGQFKDLDLRLYCLLICWFLLWTPWIASYIAKNAHGYKVWQVVLVNLFLPTCFFIYYSYYNFELIYLLNYLENPILKLFIASLGFVLLKDVYNHVNSQTEFDTACMPVQDRLKKRALIKLAHPVSNVAAVNFGAFFILGWPVVQLMFAALAFFLTFAMLGAGFAILKKMYAKEEVITVS